MTGVLSLLILSTLAPTVTLCPETINLPVDATVTLMQRFDRHAVVVAVDAPPEQAATLIRGKKNTRSSTVGFYTLAFAAPTGETIRAHLSSTNPRQISFSCDKNIDSRLFTPFELTAHVHRRKTLAGSEARLRRADRSIASGKIKEGEEAYHHLAAEAGGRAPGVAAALTDIELRQRLGLPVVGRDRWNERAEAVLDDARDEISYRMARLAWFDRKYEEAYGALQWPARDKGQEIRRQSTLDQILTEAMLSAYADNDDVTVAKWFHEQPKAVGSSSARVFLATVASLSLTELDASDEAYAPFIELDRTVFSASADLAALGAAVAGGYHDDAEALLKILNHEITDGRKALLAEAGQWLQQHPTVGVPQ